MGQAVVPQERHPCHSATCLASMVIKTDLCPYTEYRIYPGHGNRFFAKDGKTHLFISRKAYSLFRQKIKPVKLRWTQAWRRMNKKGKADEGGKKRTRKAQKFQKAIVGMSLDDIKKKKAQKPELRQQAKEAAAREAKARGKPTKTAAKGDKKAGGAKPKAGGKDKAAKNVAAPNPSKGKAGKR